jgi:hypothetical protein
VTHKGIPDIVDAADDIWLAGVETVGGGADYVPGVEGCTQA